MPNFKKSTPSDKAEVSLTNSGRTVYVQKSVTKDLGNYNSAKVAIGITLPIDFTAADIEKAHEAITKCIELVDERIEEEVNAIMEE